MKPIRPMKGVLVTPENRAKIKFPQWASFKLDGIRGIVSDGVCYSTSGKPLPSRRLQELAARMPHGLDGEWIYGEPTAADAYSKTFTAVMSIDWPAELSPDKMRFYAFEIAASGQAFSASHGLAIERTNPVDHPWIEILDQYVIESLTDMDHYYELACNSGYEGLVLRRPGFGYKQGRATENESTFWKLKPFGSQIEEAEILNWYPLMTNLNETSRNAFGLTERASTSSNKVETSLLGGFLVKDLKTGAVFRIGGGKGLTERLRSELYKKGDDLKGLVVRYTSMNYGVKDAPRHPQFRGFRDKIDLTEY
jgi:DNA ligase-1